MWKSIRNFLNDIHLYAGLTCALIVIAVCLSGTIYVYNTEIREFFDSERYFSESQGTKQSLDILKSKLESEGQGQVVGVNVFDQEKRTVQFSVKKQGEEKSFLLFVDPFTGKVLADNKEKTAAEEFMGYMFSLHRWLLLDKIEKPILESMSNMELGRFINGVATLLFLLGVLTGMVIWVPQKAKNWRQGLKVKWDANWKRVNHDLHNTLAFYSLGALFIMAVTGPFWSYQWYKTGWQKTWDIYQAPKEENKAQVKEPSKNQESSTQEVILPSYTLSLDQILAESNKQLPYEGNIKITLPEKPGGDISISKGRTGFFARAGSDQLKLDPENLQLKERALFSELPVRQQIGRSVKALHTGEIFGQLTKFLWFVGCLIATSLPITGTLIWWNKKKKKRSKFPTDSKTSMK